MKHSSLVRAFVDDDPITLTFYVFAGRRPAYRPPQSVCFRRVRPSVRACIHVIYYSLTGSPSISSLRMLSDGRRIYDAASLS